ncbi:MAG: histidine phosphatase family protein, partial [Pseudomonadota bacterium]|nr:histidine phosphatase family protein [Pseudomonadota bacterium]
MIEARPPIYFVRHGVTDWNEERRIQGQIDTSLNARGHDQSKALAHALFGVVKPDGELRFCVSPLRRAKETMGYIAHCFAIEESRIEIEPRLQELGFGIWEGRLVKELKTHHDYPRDPALLYHWRPENGESYADGTARVSPWIDRLD